VWNGPGLWWGYNNNIFSEHATAKICCIALWKQQHVLKKTHKFYENIVGGSHFLEWQAVFFVSWSSINASLRKPVPT
jgi:hypothetical protein